MARNNPTQTLTRWKSHPHTENQTGANWRVENRLVLPAKMRKITAVGVLLQILLTGKIVFVSRSL